MTTGKRNAKSNHHAAEDHSITVLEETNGFGGWTGPSSRRSRTEETKPSSTPSTTLANDVNGAQNAQVHSKKEKAFSKANKLQTNSSSKVSLDPTLASAVPEPAPTIRKKMASRRPTSRRASAPSAVMSTDMQAGTPASATDHHDTYTGKSTNRSRLMPQQSVAATATTSITMSTTTSRPMRTRRRRSTNEHSAKDMEGFMSLGISYRGMDWDPINACWIPKAKKAKKSRPTPQQIQIVTVGSSNHVCEQKDGSKTASKFMDVGTSNGADQGLQKSGNDSDGYNVSNQTKENNAQAQEMTNALPTGMDDPNETNKNQSSHQDEGRSAHLLVTEVVVHPTSCFAPFTSPDVKSKPSDCLTMALDEANLQSISVAQGDFKDTAKTLVGEAQSKGQNDTMTISFSDHVKLVLSPAAGHRKGEHNQTMNNNAEKAEKTENSKEPFGPMTTETSSHKATEVVADNPKGTSPSTNSDVAEHKATEKDLQDNSEGKDSFEGSSSDQQDQHLSTWESSYNCDESTIDTSDAFPQAHKTPNPGRTENAAIVRTPEPNATSLLSDQPQAGENSADESQTCAIETDKRTRKPSNGEAATSSLTTEAKDREKMQAESLEGMESSESNGEDGSIRSIVAEAKTDNIHFDNSGTSAEASPEDDDFVVAKYSIGELGLQNTLVPTPDTQAESLKEFDLNRRDAKLDRKLASVDDLSFEETIARKPKDQYNENGGNVADWKMQAQKLSPDSLPVVDENKPAAVSNTTRPRYSTKEKPLETGAHNINSVRATESNFVDETVDHVSQSAKQFNGSINIFTSKEMAESNPNDQFNESTSPSTTDADDDSVSSADVPKRTQTSVSAARNPILISKGSGPKRKTRTETDGGAVSSEFIDADTGHKRQKVAAASPLLNAASAPAAEGTVPTGGSHAFRSSFGSAALGTNHDDGGWEAELSSSDDYDDDIETYGDKKPAAKPFGKRKQSTTPMGALLTAVNNFRDNCNHNIGADDHPHAHSRHFQIETISGHPDLSCDIFSDAPDDTTDAVAMLPDLKNMKFNRSKLNVDVYGPLPKNKVKAALWYRMYGSMHMVPKPRSK